MTAETTPSGAAVPAFQFSALLAATPLGARTAREVGTRQLRSWGLACGAAPLIIAELATNAALHGHTGGRDFRLSLTVGVPGDPRTAPMLRIAVTDTRHTCHPVVRTPSTAPHPRTNGHGMLLVDALADAWGVEPGPAPCKTVWADLILAS